jgi:arylsulfatase A-like enzyme
MATGRPRGCGLSRRDFLKGAGAGALGALGVAAAGCAVAGGKAGEAARDPRKPNIIFILADDLGYGDLGCYGQKRIRTPHADALAAEGVRFTQAYSGSTVCAPSRCSLMTGLHMGHAYVRGNALVPLRPEDATVAEVLKAAGYTTALVGKWGLGEPETSGLPNKKGFDYFYGYLNQVHAHNYYPDYLWKNEEKVPLGNEVEAGVAKKRVEYAPDLIEREALAFIERSKDKPFFLYFSPTLPHANNEAGKGGGNGMEVPSDEPYSAEAWPQAEKNFAAMVTRLDVSVGKIMAILKRLGIDNDTNVFFTSDNGPHKEGGHDAAFFESSGAVRGTKRDLYDGGIRVPMIVRRPGLIRPATSDHVWAFWDFLPTAAEIAGAKCPDGLDGISVLPAILGQPWKGHEYLYWEFYEGGFMQAVRMGRWKAVRKGIDGKTELYDIGSDVREMRDVAAQNPEIVNRMEVIFRTARVDSPLPTWSTQPQKKPQKKGKAAAK